jgi:hypothetical protein
MVTPVPRLMVVLEFPAPLNVAVSPVPGTGVADQFASAQFASAAPVQEPLAASDCGLKPKVANRAAMIATSRIPAQMANCMVRRQILRSTAALLRK